MKIMAKTKKVVVKEDKKVEKKELLNEATIRRFMTLANLQPLTNTFVERAINEGCKMKKEEEEKEEEKVEELEEGIDIEDEENPMPEAPTAEPPAEEEPPVEAEMGKEEMVKKIVAAIATAIEEITGVSVGVNGSEEEAAPELPPEEGEVGELGGEEKEEEEPIDESKKDSLIKEISKRVASRLLKEFSIKK
jgi:hypothetical protein